MMKHYIFNKTTTILVGLILAISLNGICAVSGDAQTFSDWIPRYNNRSVSQIRASEIRAGVPLKKALNILEKRFQIAFLYQSGLMENKKVNETINISENVNETINRLLKPYPLVCKELNSKTYGIISSNGISTGMLKARKEEHTVKGNVQDATTGGPLPGVNVYIKGTTIGAVTNTKGNYELDVPSLQDTLIYSYIGYAIQTVPIQGRTTINIKLEQKTLTGQQLVVVGYGTQKKEDITGAISTISSKEIGNQPVVNVDQALEGKTAGITITQNSGSPGSSAKVLIRGLGTINNSSPLYVVDGVPLASNGINSIDPSNIASVQILKDASSEAIYGSRGANGVILITTKKGRSGQSRITINAYRGVQQVEKKLGLLNGQQFVTLNNEAYNNAGLTPPFANPPSSYTTSTNWQDAIFRPAMVEDYNLAASGGSKDITYRVSGGYFKQRGIIIGTNYDRFNFRVNSTLKPKDNVTIGEDIALNRSQQNTADEGSNSGNIVISALAMDPTVPVRLSDGTFSSPRQSDILNPVAMQYYNISPHKKVGIIGNTYLKYDIIPHLSLKTNLDIDLGVYDDPSFDPQFFVSASFHNSTPSVSHQKADEFGWVWDNTATYQRDIAQDNHIKLLVGISKENHTYDNVSGTKIGQPGNEPYLRYLDAGTSADQAGGVMTQWALLSYIGRLNYNYKSTYFLTATIRRDGSSKFGSNNRYGNFPSASVGWVLTNEPFLKNSSKFKFLDYLKLRGSWGIVGNQSVIGDYSYVSTIANYYYPFGNPLTAATTAEPSGLGNPDLKWEQDRQWDVGADFRFLNDALSASVDYYKKTTKGMILSLPILYESGFPSSAPTNAGSMENSGLEISTNYQYSQKVFSFSVGGHLSTISNKVLSLQNPGEKIYSAGYKSGNTELTMAGHPAGEFYGYVADGIFQNQQQIDSWATQPGAAPGDIRFKDVNGDGVINSKDETFLGSPYPKITYGFNGDVRYKDFDLSMSFQGVWGNKIYAAYKFYTDGFFISSYNMESEMLNRWHGEGTSNYLPRLTASDPNNNARVSSFFLQSGAYLRLRNITLSYNVPHRLLNQLDISNVKIYLTGQNLLTVTKYNGYDPIVGNLYAGNSGNLDYGIDIGTYPQPRTVSVGIDLSL